MSDEYPGSERHFATYAPTEKTCTEKMLTPDGALPAGNWPKGDLVRFAPADPLEAEITRLRAENERLKGICEGLFHIGNAGTPESPKWTGAQWINSGNLHRLWLIASYTITGKFDE